MCFEIKRNSLIICLTDFFIKKVEIRLSLVVFIIGIIFMLSLRTINQPNAFDQIYFQEWSSEDMMQTVSLLDLKNQPLQSILYLHIQPPLLDTIRLITAQVLPRSGVQTMIKQVDQSLYLSLIHISEPTRLGMISYAVFC